MEARSKRYALPQYAVIRWPYCRLVRHFGVEELGAGAATFDEVECFSPLPCDVLLYNRH